MACPYFVPLEPLDDARWIQPPRLPLGAACRGSCAAPGAAGGIPENTLEEICNWGYARDRCARFPAEEAVDALRLSLLRDGRLVWIEEADHRPLRHGEWSPGIGSAALDAQARVFLGRQRR